MVNRRDSNIRVMDLPSRWEHEVSCLNAWLDWLEELCTEAEAQPDMSGPENERGRLQLMMQIAAEGRLPASVASQQFSIDFEHDREEAHMTTATTPVPTAALYLAGVEALLREASSMLVEIEGSEARECAKLTHKARCQLINCSGENPPKRVGAARKRFRRVLEEVPVGSAKMRKVHACLEAANNELRAFAQDTHVAVGDAIAAISGRLSYPGGFTLAITRDLGMAIEEFVEEGG